MVRISVLGDALKTMYNAEKRGKVRRRPLAKGDMGSAVAAEAAAVLGCWGQQQRLGWRCRSQSSLLEVHRLPCG